MPRNDLFNLDDLLGRASKKFDGTTIGKMGEQHDELMSQRTLPFEGTVTGRFAASDPKESNPPRRGIKKG